MPGVSGTNLWLSKYTRQTVILFACVVMSAPLNGCGGSTASDPSASPALETAENPEAIAPLTGAAPPDASKRPPKPGESGRPMGADGLPQLQAKGINYEQLFTERISDENKRFDRVENAVLDLRRDFEAVLPAVMRLVAVEGDIQNLVGQLETLLQNEPLPAEPLPANPVPPIIEDLAPEPDPSNIPPKAAAEPAPAMEGQTAAAGIPERESSEPPVAMAQEATAPPASMAPTPITPAAAPSATAPSTAKADGVSGLRFGVDGGKTRIVIDAGKAVTYKKDLDNGESLLVVELPGTPWNMAAQGNAPAGALVQSWSTQAIAETGGTRLIMILKKPVTIAYEAALKPETSSPYHRIVLDLRPNG